MLQGSTLTTREWPRSALWGLLRSKGLLQPSAPFSPPPILNPFYTHPLPRLSALLSSRPPFPWATHLPLFPRAALSLISPPAPASPGQGDRPTHEQEGSSEARLERSSSQKELQKLGTNFQWRLEVNHQELRLNMLVYHLRKIDKLKKNKIKIRIKQINKTPN